MIYRKYFKRIFDLIMSLTGFIILLPLTLTIAFLLALINRANPFFIQPRPGKGGKTFNVVKFRTMNNNKDANGKLLPDKYRLTKLGRFVRGSSLDELPQLINVILGKMSLVGPRPLLTDYLPLYSTVQARRHEVLPGITGWAQVSGRNALTWEKKFEHDVWYVDNISFLLDIKIILITIWKVVRKHDINSRSSATMERFVGTVVREERREVSVERKVVSSEL